MFKGNNLNAVRLFFSFFFFVQIQFFLDGYIRFLGGFLFSFRGALSFTFMYKALLFHSSLLCDVFYHLTCVTFNFLFSQLYFLPRIKYAISQYVWLNFVYGDFSFLLISVLFVWNSRKIVYDFIADLFHLYNWKKNLIEEKCKRVNTLFLCSTLLYIYRRKMSIQIRRNRDKKNENWITIAFAFAFAEKIQSIWIEWMLGWCQVIWLLHKMQSNTISTMRLVTNMDNIFNIILSQHTQKSCILLITLLFDEFVQFLN